MYLEKVVINNIKNIEHFEMEFSKSAGWHVLIGDNGAGKSSVLQAIAAAIIGEEVNVFSLKINFKNWVTFGKTESLIKLRVKRNKNKDSFNGNPPAWHEASIRILKNGKIEYLGKDSPINIIREGKRGWFSSSFGPYRRHSGGKNNWENFYESKPRLAVHLPLFFEEATLNKGLEWLDKLSHKSLDKNENATKALNNIQQFINQGALLPNGAIIKKISSEGVFIEDRNGEQIDFDNLSDGYRSVLGLTFEIIRLMVENFEIGVFKKNKANKIEIVASGVILIDEVDAHLHPTWQTRIGEWFQKYFPKIQFIVSTHSPLICRAAKNGSIWRLAAPGSNMESGEITGVEKERLIYGNVLEAFGTEAFGQGVERSQESQEKLEKLADLENRHSFGLLSQNDIKEMNNLRKIFTTDDIFNL